MVAACTPGCGVRIRVHLRSPSLNTTKPQFGHNTPTVRQSARSIKQRDADHAVWHTVATALVEASEERWVRLMSKSLYLHHSRQQLCSMARVKRRERKNASNTESEASFKRPVLLSSSPDRGASQKAARNSDLERRSFLASDPIVLTTHRPTKRLPLCSTHKGTTVSLFSYSTHKCALLLHPELRRWWWDWGGGTHQ